MLEECAGRIADVLSSNKIIKPEDKEIYVYGLDALLSTAINLVVITTLSLILGVFTETAVFILAFAALRAFAGGYHAKTHIGCIAAFTGSYLTVITIIRLTPDDLAKILAALLAILSAVLLFALAPVEHKNRPFEGDEYQKFRKTSRIIAGLEVLVVFIAIIIIPSLYHFAYCVSLAMLNAVVVLAIAKKIK